MHQNRATDPYRTRRLRTTFRLISVGAIVGIGVAVVWFVVSAMTESGAHMTAASAMAAGVGAAWSAAFAAVRSRQKAADEEPSQSTV
ncbi:hypothetical protein [Microbacterium sp. WCS2018Hpa-23]|uniref:hypothetical protein n=1 Tax=Microbacterium sp. WCS2018Hpa-23 TaxID=3073634 RepID=UPI0028834FCC|nr:hypothetical protein [Microbacterium sp. WCS2018Hpa-23]